VSWKDLKRGVLPDAYRLEDKLKINSSQPLPGTPKWYSTRTVSLRHLARARVSFVALN